MVYSIIGAGEAHGPSFGLSWKDCEVALFLNVNLFFCVRVPSRKEMFNLETRPRVPCSVKTETLKHLSRKTQQFWQDPRRWLSLTVKWKSHSISGLQITQVHQHNYSLVASQQHRTSAVPTRFRKDSLHLFFYFPVNNRTSHCNFFIVLLFQPSNRVPVFFLCSFGDKMYVLAASCPCCTLVSLLCY